MSLGRTLVSLTSTPFTCLCRSHAVRSTHKIAARSLSLSSAQYSEDNKDYKINPEFVNRNDRCLEYMNVSPRRKGWRFQQPSRNFYYKLHINPTSNKIEAYLEHSSGRKVVYASSSEWAIRQFLYSARDVSAAVNTGRVFADRCQKAGIVNVYYDPVSDSHGGEKIKAVLNALEEAGIEIGEEAVHEGEFKPGIKYDGKNRVGEKHRPDDIQIV
ncbi:large ribosomal subunit protein uL18m-like [Saccostrea echinata]|uniref:large ribosomal subunit protein uL18m-like n=1 Tax=Saccostrea echinata TaxID=191078 RepID=UPI002A80F6E8|nr:large ribosomal subunit protein uL18m-like [Saccostrea echinata]